MQLRRSGGLPVDFRVHNTETGQTLVLNQLLFDPDELQAASEHLTPHHATIYVGEFFEKIDPLYRPFLPWFYRHMVEPS
mgnify:FL=1